MTPLRKQMIRQMDLTHFEQLFFRYLVISAKYNTSVWSWHYLFRAWETK